MSVEFTPGPWVYEWAGSAARIFKDYGEAPPRLIVYMPYRGDMDEATHHANARLIAAAPDLLAALEALLEDWNTDDVQEGLEQMDSQGFRNALAAVVKARGEQS